MVCFFVFDFVLLLILGKTICFFFLFDFVLLVVLGKTLGCCVFNLSSFSYIHKILIVSW